jgi:hypothetical protein
VVAPPSRPAAPAGVAAPAATGWNRRGGSVGHGLPPSASSLSGETSRCQRGRQGRLAAQMCLTLPNHPELLLRWGAALAGEFLQRLAHCVCCLVTARGAALADRAAFQGDDPSIQAGPVGVDADGVAAVAGRPEPVPSVVFALYCTLAMAGSYRPASQPLDTRRPEAKRIAAGAPMGPRDSGQQRSITVPHGQSNLKACPP